MNRYAPLMTRWLFTRKATSPEDRFSRIRVAKAALSLGDHGPDPDEVLGSVQGTLCHIPLRFQIAGAVNFGGQDIQIFRLPLSLRYGGGRKLSLLGGDAEGCVYGAVAGIAS
jgi:hypothetical protein